MAVIQNYLAKTTSKWVDIGVQLELDPEYLENLRGRKKSSDNDNLRQMILTWLKGEGAEPTWRALCDALRAAAVDEAKIAKTIEEERLHSASLDLPELDNSTIHGKNLLVDSQLSAIADRS